MSTRNGVPFRQNLVSPSKYSIKAPYAMTPKMITLHNTWNTATANNEASYHNSNNNTVSFHFVVDEKEIVQTVPVNRNAFHAGDGGNGYGNRNTIGVEIARSRSDKDTYDKAEENAVKFVAHLLYEYGWDISKVKSHFNWSSKWCPHRVLDEKRWDSLLKRIDNELQRLKKPVSTPSQASKPTQSSNETAQNPPTKTYKVVKSINGYINAIDAKSKKNKKATVKEGTYHVFKESQGMINVTSKQGVAGSWINPSENVIAAKPSVPTPATAKKYTSIVDYLNANKIDSSFNNRKKLAAQYGIKNYTGTASQNTQLLNAMQNGKAPVQSAPSQSVTLKVGAKVKIKSSAKKYSRANVNIPSSVKNKTYTIQQVGNDDVLLKEIVSWVKKADVQ